MDRKLLFKSNIMGNTVMRRNRAAKSNSERNLKRKELFARGRDISESPEEPPKETEPTTSKKALKKEEMAKKEEAYRARFALYMQEKRQRLEKEKANKKPPFISAAGGNSSHIVTQKSFVFAVPKPSSKNCKSVENTVNTRSKVVKRNGKTKKPENIKIDQNHLNVPRNILKETPVMKDKLFVFNSVGSVLTSTVRKSINAKERNLGENLEDVFSPIDGIAPLEASLLGHQVEDNKENKPTEILSKPQNTANSLKPSSAEKKTPPPKDIVKNSENFYVSPFVTTSRGKGSAKKERKTRDSVYRLELNHSIEEPIEIRRRRVTVKYYRKLVQDELNRLNELCMIWETYKQENANRFEEHCADMINVALGQTKLLVAGKFKQCIKLIDNCEKFANECKDIAKIMSSQDDVAPEDVEGFWNIVKLQIENVDRRFDNLTSWKNNNWTDPDEKSKPKRRPLTKQMKTKMVKQKLNPKSEIKSLILKAHREFLKNKANQNMGPDQDIIFVGRRSQLKNESKIRISGLQQVSSPLKDEPIEVKEKRAAIKSFRKLLNDEKTRLDGLCSTWNTFQQENATELQENSADMINVAIGQTRLLLSGKLKQFEKLVDDCDKIVNESKNKAMKFTTQNNISPADLDGYWGMVKHQIENLDRRFENLTLWKNNDWKEPDENIRDKRNSLAKPMKPKKPKLKIKSRDGIKNLLMKARQEYLNNKKTNNDDADQDVIFVSRRSQVKANFNLSTPTKPNSGPIPTRFIKTPYRTSIGLRENRPHRVLTPVQRRLSVLKRSSSGEICGQRTPVTSHTATTRKSILKSESKSTQKKTVLFSEQIQYKSPDVLPSAFRRFSSANKYEESPRIMHLRTRKVLCREDLSDSE